MRFYAISRFPESKALLGLLACTWGLLLGGFSAPVRAEPLADAQLLRQSGCGGLVPGMRPLRHIGQLDEAAEQWAFGRSLTAAAERAGYTAGRLAGVHVTAIDAALLQSLRRTSCSTLMSPDLTDIGTYRRGRDVWLVLASASAAARGAEATRAAEPTRVPEPTRVAPASTPSQAFSTRVLELVNRIRARGTSCGERAFGPSTPVRPSAVLEQVAYGHAHDMAEHAYFEHKDLAGRTPSDRVRAAGYREKLVGENIAYGPKSPEEVVSGWLDSPGHCENIMDPRFAEMGVAYTFGHAPGRTSSRGLYWVQVLADPKT